MALEELPALGATDWYGWAAQTDMFARNPRTNPLSELAPGKLRMEKLTALGVNGGVEQTMLDVTGPGVIQSFWMAIAGGPGPAMDARIRVFYDGNTTPDIDIDLGTLLATHYGAGAVSMTNHTTVHVHTQVNPTSSNTGFLITFPMPFGESMKMTYYNVNTQFAEIYSMITYRLTPVDYANGLRLRAQGARLLDQFITRQPETVVTLADITGGPGAIVWHSQVGGIGATNMTWLERNFSIWVDGEAEAAIAATGTEDWFDSAYYFEALQDFSAGNHSYVAVDRPNASFPYVAGMATDLLSKWGGVPFTSSAVMTADTEVGSQTADSFSYCVLYYSAA